MAPGQESVLALIKKKGLACLTKDFLPVDGTILRLQCEKGHVWSSTIRFIKGKADCSKCRNQEQIAEMQALAARFDGKCLSTEYVNVDQFDRAPYLIKNGVWCSTCLRQARVGKKYHKHAAERGGKVVECNLGLLHFCT